MFLNFFAKKKCYFLSFPILGGRNLTSALQSSPFQISGGVVQAWRRRRTNANPCVLYRMPKNITTHLINYKHSKTQTKTVTRKYKFWPNSTKKIIIKLKKNLKSHWLEFWPISKSIIFLVLRSIGKNNSTTNTMYYSIQHLAIFLYSFFGQDLVLKKLGYLVMKSELKKKLCFKSPFLK